MPKDMKYDGGKPYASTLYSYFPKALLAVAEVSTFGAKKYARGSFAAVPNGKERYTDAMHRHFLQEASGEAYDDESGLLHATHAAWGALCRLEFILKEIADEQSREKKDAEAKKAQEEPSGSATRPPLFRPLKMSDLENFIPAKIKKT